jgi:hypothetical protein
MTPTDHEHNWVPASNFPDLRCAVCGASHSAIQTMLGEAADDARRVVGEGHYTGCRVRQELEKLELWLFEAPSSVLAELEAIRPGVWLIHNDAPRTEAVLFELMDALPVDRLRAEGIHVVGVGPTQDGFLHVSVMGDVPTAQARLDAMFGGNVARVEYGEPVRALPLRGP